MNLTDKKKKAKELKIKFEETVTEEQLDDLIAVAEAKKIQDVEEKKIEDEAAKKASSEAKKTQIVLKDVEGNDVDQADYFYSDSETKSKNIAPSYFNKTDGVPVEREDLIEVFNNVFSKNKKFLFYRCIDKEVYLIIVPLKYATTIGKSNESLHGSYQRHALSFIGEGSVNIDSLKMKLAKVANHPSISKEPLA